MVLSNKKLKQKLREKLAESLISSVAGKDTNGDVSGEPDTESRQQSLKELLDSTSRHGPRLSKREKRRESLILTGSDGNKDEKKEDESRGLGEIKREKKRKRDGGMKEKGAADELEEDNEKAKKLKKKKKQQQKKKKSNKKAKNGEEEKEKKEDVGGNEVKGQVEETQQNIGSEFNENLTTKVYVGGIPYYSTEDDICCFFESCGTITEIDCMKFPESGKFRGIAILNFKTEAAAKRALAWDGADMGGLFLKVQPYKETRTNRAVDFSPGIVEGYNRIYLGNLSWDITEDDLKKLFADCKIASIRFGMDKETGEFRGYAHVDFSDSVSLKTALKLDQKTIHGRPVKIRCAVPKKGAERRGGAAATAETHPEAHPKPMPETKEGAENVVSSVSGKIKRRTCYECGEKGHLSSDCPKKEGTDRRGGAGTAETHPEGTERGAATAEMHLEPMLEMKETAENGVSSVSGKLKRTCYECGEKGHLSSDCPKKEGTDRRGGAGTAETHPEGTERGAATAETHLEPMPEKKEAAENGVSSVSGKIKRRTCYECGEKGHLSSNCPKKEGTERRGGAATAETHPETHSEPMPETKEAAENVASSVSGKIRRRTCYECGEKGHLSSNCPKKQLADSVPS